LVTFLEVLVVSTSSNSVKMNFFNVPDEFKKNPELNEDDLNHLREWISKQPHLPLVTGK